VDDAGAVFRRDEIAGENPERVFGVLEIGEHRFVVAADQPGARKGVNSLGFREFHGVARKCRRSHYPIFAVPFDRDVFRRRADGERQVRRKRPWRGRPGEETRAIEFAPPACIWRLRPQAEGDRERRIRALYHRATGQRLNGNPGSPEFIADLARRPRAF
jgi:hypothetical protein